MTSQVNTAHKEAKSTYLTGMVHVNRVKGRGEGVLYILLGVGLCHMKNEQKKRSKKSHMSLTVARA